MTQVHLSAERQMRAPADVVYRCIADYRQHHRPEGFLPPQFSDFRVERGGVGAGSVISFNFKMGGRTQAFRQEVSEPEPGRVLVEAGLRERTTFTVEPDGQACRVRIDTTVESTGIQGLLTRLLAPRMLAPVYADELERLERYAQALG